MLIAVLITEMVILHKYVFIIIIIIIIIIIKKKKEKEKKKTWKAKGSKTDPGPISSAPVKKENKKVTVITHVL